MLDLIVIRHHSPSICLFRGLLICFTESDRQERSPGAGGTSRGGFDRGGLAERRDDNVITAARKLRSKIVDRTDQVDVMAGLRQRLGELRRALGWRVYQQVAGQWRRIHTVGDALANPVQAISAANGVARKAGRGKGDKQSDSCFHKLPPNPNALLYFAILLVAHDQRGGKLNPSKTLKNATFPVFISSLAGFLAGLAGYHVATWLPGFHDIDEQVLAERQATIAALQEENQKLYDELFTLNDSRNMRPVDLIEPYDEEADADAAVAAARLSAVDEQKFLMVIFGANWCLDCRTLHLHLSGDEVQSYASERMAFVNVNVGKFNRNVELASQLGVNLERGIPVAIFFGPDGRVVGTTNNGELEPARLYSSKQILRFVRDVAERSRILAPNAVR